MKAIGTYHYHDEKCYFMNPNGFLMVSEDIHNFQWAPVQNPPKELEEFIQDFVSSLENSLKGARVLLKRSKNNAN